MVETISPFDRLTKLYYAYILNRLNGYKILYKQSMLIRFMKKLKKLWQRSIVYRVFVKKYRRYFIIGAISLIIVDIINIFPPLIIKKTIDMLSGDSNMRGIAY